VVGPDSERFETRACAGRRSLIGKGEAEVREILRQAILNVGSRMCLLHALLIWLIIIAHAPMRTMSVGYRWTCRSC